MKTCHGLDRSEPPAGGVVLTVGNFDGVHLGHQELVRVARQIAKGASGVRVAVLTFEPHPRQVLTPQFAPPRLTSPDDKLRLLGEYGVDDAIVLRSDAALFQRSAGEFLENVVEVCRPIAIVEGASFSFGRGREGSIAMLDELAGKLGFELSVVDTMVCEALPGKPGVSSSAIRDAVSRGDVSAAEAMLSRPYSICGIVEDGAGRGVGLGFPTANLERVLQMVPGEAVYAAVAEPPDDRPRLAAVNVGPQPTFDSDVRRIEAHLLDFEGDLRGLPLRLHFLERIRAQRRFAGAGELAAQVKADVATVRRHADRLGSFGAASET